MKGVLITAIICLTLIAIVYIGNKYGNDCSDCKNYEKKNK